MSESKVTFIKNRWFYRKEVDLVYYNWNVRKLVRKTMAIFLCSQRINLNFSSLLFHFFATIYVHEYFKSFLWSFFFSALFIILKNIVMLSIFSCFMQRLRLKKKVVVFLNQKLKVQARNYRTILLTAYNICFM